MYPKREEFQWRPSPILCKRFDLVDPYMGKPPPAPRARSKMDTLIFMPDSIRTKNVEEHVSADQASSQVHNGKQDRETSEKEIENEVEIENVERPIDLYKAIFSDDEDDEEENNTYNQAEDPQKKIEAANTTLNRLMAGDFLESLGKELGLLVPPEMPLPEIKPGASIAQKETTMVADKNVVGSSTYGGITEKRRDDLRNIPEGRSNIVKLQVEDDSKENKLAKVSGEDKHPNTSKTRNWSSSSSEGERSRKTSRSRRHKSKRRNSDSDASSNSDNRDRHSSRSRRDDKETSRERSSSRKHSKHRKHRRKDSLSRSHRSSEHEKRKRKKNKYDE